jgi:hypothetical protein
MQLTYRLPKNGFLTKMVGKWIEMVWILHVPVKKAISSFAGDPHLSKRGSKISTSA